MGKTRLFKKTGNISWYPGLHEGYALQHIDNVSITGMWSTSANMIVIITSAWNFFFHGKPQSKAKEELIFTNIIPCLHLLQMIESEWVTCNLSLRLRQAKTNIF